MGTKLKVGDPAPRFQLPSYNAGLIDLGQLIGTHKIVLIFSRYFGCPICQMELDDLLEKFPAIEAKGATVLYITQSSREQAEEFIRNKQIPFPVIPSNKTELYAQYGLGMMNISSLSRVPGMLIKAKSRGIAHGPFEGWEQQNPGQFVIGLNGNLIHVKLGWQDLDSLLQTL
jgi:peroxiredoxin